MPQTISEQILLFLQEREFCDTLQLSEDLKVDHQDVIGAMKSLEGMDQDLIRTCQMSCLKVEATPEGKMVAEKGSHEAQVFEAVPNGEDGILSEEVMGRLGTTIGKVGVSKAIANKWLKTVKDPGDKLILIRAVGSIEDAVRTNIKAIIHGSVNKVDPVMLAELKKRKLVKRNVITYFRIGKGTDFSLGIAKSEAELTSEMLLKGTWRNTKFKPYNFKCLGTPPRSGSLHPLMKMRTEIRSILLEMGFSEMKPGKWVESSFWNFDALFVPQKHPARDKQDTFFMSQPSNTGSVPQELMNRVKNAHTGRGSDTLGYGPTWTDNEALRNCLRTHTTAASARMLWAMASSEEFREMKMFSIDRVFRNETLDQTHLAEFHQVEGLIAGYDLNLGNLIGTLNEFYERMGISKLRYKPAYNPYTEPSLEIFAYHEDLKKWLEIGNSGIFRPEVLEPLGVPKNYRVIAWGLSLERPTMIKYGLDNIRKLVGHKVDLQLIYDSPLCNLYR